MDKYKGRKGSWYGKKENSEFKPVKLCLKIDLLSLPADVDIYIYIYIQRERERERGISTHHTQKHTHTHTLSLSLSLSLSLTHTHTHIYTYISTCRIEVISKHVCLIIVNNVTIMISI